MRPQASPNSAWLICVDTGGTFTDAVGHAPDSTEIRRAKVLSSGVLRATVARSDPTSLVIKRPSGFDPAVLTGFRARADGVERTILIAAARDQEITLNLDAELHPRNGVELLTGEEAPVLAARLLTGTPPGRPFPPLQLRLATTRGTNALLTRRVAPVALFVTRGFRDLLEIGTQQRPDLFALDVIKPRMLHQCAIEVNERLAADGSLLRPLDEDSLRARAIEALREGVTCAAVALLHADRHPQHEKRVRDILREVGFTHITCSHEAAPYIKVVTRAQTAVVDAALGPVVQDYLAHVAGALRDGENSTARLLMLTSAGGLVDAADFRAKDSLLSGPAGGVVGARMAAARSGFTAAISFDMGGTSTDVARLRTDTRAESLVFEHRVADAHLAAPAVGVETVAAGGGSICSFDGVRLSVGPTSAGASPGPACYAMGGPLTLTDVNLLLGRLDPSRLPIPIDSRPSELALADVQTRLAHAHGANMSREDLLDAFVRLAAERMAGAVRRVSAAEGYDPRDHVLVAFGGAGGQHACDVADILSIRTVLAPADAGLLSARGLAAAPLEHIAERQVLRTLREVGEELSRIIQQLRTQADDALRRALTTMRLDDRLTDSIETRVIAALRLRGQETTLEIELPTAHDAAPLFAARYRAVYGHSPESTRDIELVWLRAIASAALTEHHNHVIHAQPSEPSSNTHRAWFGAWRDVPSFDRRNLYVGWRTSGPALIFEDHATVVVPPQWTVHVDAAGALVLHNESPTTTAVHSSAGASDEVALELFTSRCESIAKEMGEALRRTAVSTNVKERLDFSCAILDAHAELIVNAPHVPVHLGSLGLCVRRVRDAIDMRPGDVIITNHPGLGGSHLPDVTIITPMFDSHGHLFAYAASRAHHAEIGGIRPGSMPPGATRLIEEGVVIAPMHLVRAGTPCYDDLAHVLRSAKFPSRAVSDNLADIRAAAAANQRAVAAMTELVSHLGADRVATMFEHIKSRAHRAATAALQAIPDGDYHAEEFLDDGSPLRVKITLRAGSAIIDFTGSAAVHPGNLNATPAIVRSAVIYVLRLLVTDPLPLNEGLLRGVQLILPEGMLNPTFSADPAHAPAVSGGNVETSQRLVDTLLKALNVAACSQGTMNNVIFGTQDGRMNYYETVCGGCGATPRAPGASGVHSHMTNTRITDPEILETRYPVRLELFELRRDSGGAGLHPGGDGVVRALTFLAPSSLSIITQHRTSGPYGMSGGAPGAPGRQRVIRATGEVLTLAPADICEINSGDTLILETPGGGGWGA